MANPNVEENTPVKKIPTAPLGKPEKEVKANEDASLQDESYSFDEANTDNEEYHDAMEVDEDRYDVDDYLHD